MQLRAHRRLGIEVGDRGMKGFTRNQWPSASGLLSRGATSPVLQCNVSEP